MKALDWFEVREIHTVPSPSLLIYRERVMENLRRMIVAAGQLERLRPHLKTHKMPELVRLQLSLGIKKFKCATIAEAEMAAGCGVPDLLIAYQLVGPNVSRLVQLIQTYPQTRFSVIVDDAQAIRSLAHALSAPLREQPIPSGNSNPLEVLLDLDIGQHRTGIPPGPPAVALYQLIDSLPALKPGGLHAYDGHIHDTDVAARTAACEKAFQPVAALRRTLLKSGLPVPRIVAGGTPTFPMHARRDGVECSPGTCIFWDAGYASKLPDLEFLPAALLLTRVVSKPVHNCLCLDLGHKAVASEMPPPRVQFPNVPDAKALAHNEEHLVIETARAKEYAVGDCLYAIPWHICPTVALHAEAWIIEKGKVITTWEIPARQRRLTI